MRKITEQACTAFMAGHKFNSGNTTVIVGSTMVRMYLHGNEIARRDLSAGTLEVTDAGWSTATTKDRLNGIPGVRVVQHQYKWFLNAQKWDGSWRVVEVV